MASDDSQNKSDDFERAVERAIADLPRELRRQLDECSVIVMDWADSELKELMGGIRRYQTPYGFYIGTPIDKRDIFGGGPFLPDRIFLFRGPLVADFPDPERLIEEIRVTLFHELGHLIGLDEDDLERRGLE